MFWASTLGQNPWYASTLILLIISSFFSWIKNLFPIFFLSSFAQRLFTSRRLTNSELASKKGKHFPTHITKYFFNVQYSDTFIIIFSFSWDNLGFIFEFWLLLINEWNFKSFFVLYFGDWIAIWGLDHEIENEF